MARMQKKKPADRKKKKKSEGASDAGGTEVENAGSGGVAVGKSSATEARQKKQKTSYSGGTRTAARQTVAVRLLDRYFGNWIQFLREVKVELSRVTWPSRRDTMATTAVVLVFVFIIAGYLGIVDLILTSLIRLIL